VFKGITEMSTLCLAQSSGPSYTMTTKIASFMTSTVSQ